ncbi:hypothetical protein NHX12_008942 [Muraenolepis orangiensis]|uniref:Uncharacterized protein n=1 Tax=Muraenolepis orangiensis TaxID=630683 RepID=A0A9Q0I9U8_9TELE|nr:hypothetical protein NHX12_008942 [Muraenolepis orangiensis]
MDLCAPSLASGGICPMEARCSSSEVLLISEVLLKRGSPHEVLLKRGSPHEVLLKRGAPQARCSSSEVLLKRGAPQARFSS